MALLDLISIDFTSSVSQWTTLGGLSASALGVAGYAYLKPKLEARSLDIDTSAKSIAEIATLNKKQKLLQQLLSKTRRYQTELAHRTAAYPIYQNWPTDFSVLQLQSANTDSFQEWTIALAERFQRFLIIQGDSATHLDNLKQELSGTHFAAESSLYPKDCALPSIKIGHQSFAATDLRQFYKGSPIFKALLTDTSRSLPSYIQDNLKQIVAATNVNIAKLAQLEKTLQKNLTQIDRQLQQLRLESAPQSDHVASQKKAKNKTDNSLYKTEKLKVQGKDQGSKSPNVFHEEKFKNAPSFWKQEKNAETAGNSGRSAILGPFTLLKQLALRKVIIPLLPKTQQEAFEANLNSKGPSRSKKIDAPDLFGDARASNGGSLFASEDKLALDVLDQKSATGSLKSWGIGSLYLAVAICGALLISAFITIKDYTLGDKGLNYAYVLYLQDTNKSYFSSGSKSTSAPNLSANRLHELPDYTIKHDFGIAKATQAIEKMLKVIFSRRYKLETNETENVTFEVHTNKINAQNFNSGSPLSYISYGRYTPIDEEPSWVNQTPAPFGADFRLSSPSSRGLSAGDRYQNLDALSGTFHSDILNTNLSPNSEISNFHYHTGGGYDIVVWTPKSPEILTIDTVTDIDMIKRNGLQVFLTQSSTLALYGKRNDFDLYLPQSSPDLILRHKTTGKLIRIIAQNHRDNKFHLFDTPPVRTFLFLDQRIEWPYWKKLHAN